MHDGGERSIIDVDMLSEEGPNVKLKPWQTSVFSMLVIVGVGFVLFNVAFILAYAVMIGYELVVMPFADRIGDAGQIHFSWHYIYLLLVLLLSWIVLHRPLPDLVKATFFTLPLVVVLTEVGIQFYRWPVLVWVIGAVIVGAVLSYLYKTKQSWLYYFATFYVVAAEIFVLLSGMEI